MNNADSILNTFKKLKPKINRNLCESLAALGERKLDANRFCSNIKIAEMLDEFVLKVAKDWEYFRLNGTLKEEGALTPTTDSPPPENSVEQPYFIADNVADAPILTAEKSISNGFETSQLLEQPVTATKVQKQEASTSDAKAETPLIENDKSVKMDGATEKTVQIDKIDLLSTNNQRVLNPHFLQPQQLPKTKISMNSNEDLRMNIKLPNAKVGIEYLYKIDFDKLSIEQFEVSGMEETGLVYNKTTRAIEGTPVKAGDFKFKFKYKYIGSDAGNRPFIEKNVPLIINPDPKSLWKDVPSDINEIFWKEDSATELILPKPDGPILVAASKRGRSHAHEGKCRDDDFGLKYFDNSGWYVAVVCDGAGSAKFSRKGSELACTTMLGQIEVLLEKECTQDTIAAISKSKDSGDPDEAKKVKSFLYKTIGTASFGAYKAIQEFSKTKGEIKDFATTLLSIVAKKFEFGWFIGSYWVGDGAIGVYNKQQYVELLGTPDSGEFAGQTRFLTMNDVWESNTFYGKLKYCIKDEFSAVILMTDGVSDPKFDAESNLEKIEKWDEFWQDISNAVALSRGNPVLTEQLLNWLDFWSPGNHDDRTIAMLLQAAI